MKCALVGCNQDAVYISCPEMRSNIYCRKHFFEIYDDPKRVVEEK